MNGCPPFFQFFSCGQKYFEMILANQKCVFDEQKLGFKYSKNQKYFKNYFVKILKCKSFYHLQLLWKGMAH